jgi:hypothetical protein
VALTGCNRHDVTRLLPLIDKIPPVRGRRGRPRRRPDQLFADRAYDHTHRAPPYRPRASDPASAAGCCGPTPHDPN